MSVCRKDFSKIKEVLELPDLIEVQTSSYEGFLQRHVLPGKRKSEGLQAVFEEVFPIVSPDGDASLEFVDYSVGEPQYEPDECQRRGKDYAAPLKVKLRLIIMEKGEDGKVTGRIKEQREQEVFFGEVPIMTERGTFIINGAERVVVTQLHRSPGVSFERKEYANRKLYSARIIPYRGSWIEFDFDMYGVLNVSIDRKRKIPFTVLLRALGYDSDEKMVRLFYDVEEKAADRKLEGKFVGRSVRDEEGFVLAEVCELITSELLEKLKRRKVRKVFVILSSEGEPYFMPALKKDTIKSQEEALLDIYHRLRPGDSPSLGNAKAFMSRLFFDRRFYDLGEVGRFKLNRKLGMKVPPGQRTLVNEDIVETIRYLFRLRNGEGRIDDIDHLGNRRVRTVGELVQNQFRVGMARMERAIRDRFSMQDMSSAMPYNLMNTRFVASTVKDFFARSQLSQFMDQTNPLAELTHKRRLSALGPGGLSRERAGFQVRDVHFSHYGRICPIETPEGPNIGLIVSLSTYVRINRFGFLETPYRKVVNGRVKDNVEYLSADIEDEHVIAQANARLDGNGRFLDESILSRFGDGFPRVSPDRVEYMDVCPKQLVSIAASLVPFLEHDDANRALMGCNMQRQAVPLLRTEAPLVGTGMEHIAARDSGAVVLAKASCVITGCASDSIRVEEEGGKVREYPLKKLMRSNQSTCLDQKPVVYIGDRVKKGEVIADGPAIKCGELALGRNVLVVFMPWGGYNFEDAILISEKVVKQDIYTSVHIDEFNLEARDTKLGPEEITRDIPNVAEGALANLDEEGIVRIGAEVKPGDILVGKVTPKSETELSPEEKLLRAIFGEKAADVRDASLTAPSGVEGIVVDVKVFSRKEGQSEEDLKKISRLRKNCKQEINKLNEIKDEKLLKLLEGKKLAEDFVNEGTGKVILAEGKQINAESFAKLDKYDLTNISVRGDNISEKVEKIIDTFEFKIGELQEEEDRKIDKIRRGDELPPGVIKLVKVYVASKRKLSAGDKMAGRHGNKGVIAKILPEEDMPHLSDGTPVEMVLNPLGVPSRMNVGQILETHLGWAARMLGFSVASPVFSGATEAEIKKCLVEAGLPENGKTTLYDGRTGETFDQKVTVGYMYMMKLFHLVDDKVHARSIGPYSLVTQQPLGGKAQFGGQRFGEMEVWALEAYGAAYTLQELLTVKSDDVEGRTRIYETIVKGENNLRPGTPESFNVLVKELQGLGLDVKLERSKSHGVDTVLSSIETRVTVFDSISIGIASSELVKSWSKGEIKKPETINYRTFKPEKDGLFCEKIFGPTHDWECSCGKYKRVKHKGVICDRCGVEVTQSKVRRERMGHISLSAPVAHVWFFKVMPSRIGNLLDLPLRSLERVVYYEDYIVVDSGDTTLDYKQILTEEEFRKYKEVYGDRFKAMMGGEAVRTLLKQMDLKVLSEQLSEEINKTSSKQKLARLGKRLRVVKAFRESGNKTEWMVMDVIPVIPADLRPLVALDGGRFATSDLNDLYRRVINRNERLRHLISISAPDIIIRNEKRMLQEAVDALFDNGRRGRPVTGPGNRPLKSLSDMLRGKQGRFRQNLLGKRVDYSGRSVIVIGPELKLHQCGLPKKMALELFEPFIIKELKTRGFVHTIRSAKKMVEKIVPEVWDILDDVIKEHPVLLNRAPTLHRLGIQAFEPVLIEGKAIQIHPLVCTAFNADFDGDQMAVHVPLSTEAQLESRILMMSSNNIFSPADGKPITVPTQDIVLGCCYFTKERTGNLYEGKMFTDPGEVLLANSLGCISIHTRIKVRINGKLIDTTVGRVIFNDALPPGLPFFNEQMDKSKLENVISTCYETLGHGETVSLLDILKDIGFDAATAGGISICMDDMEIPAEKTEILREAGEKVEEVSGQYKKGFITEGERLNKVIDIWTHATDRLSDVLFKNLSRVDGGFNPIFMMADSGARGSRLQIRQLAGMRGLMAKPSGEIIESPITANFREGLKVLEYFISTHGARKGLADTALKTADSGYLTRRLVDVAQDLIIGECDCGTIKGITVSGIFEGENIVITLGERIVGRICQEDVVIPGLGDVLVKAGEIIDGRKASLLEEAGVDAVKIRSVLTCERRHGVCAKCYGWNLAEKKLVEVGEAVGVIAAQSIGEPGTQLTMRTFHIGGTASRIVERSRIAAREGGTIRYHGLRTVVNRERKVIVLNRNGSVTIHDEEGRELEKYHIPVGANVKIPDGGQVEKGKVFVDWDPYTVSIFTEMGGEVVFEDIVEDVTVRQELDEVTGLSRLTVTEHKEEKHPQIVISGREGDMLSYYSIPTGAHIVVKDGEKVEAGDLLAKTPRQITGTKDITGGLPRVAELFEARRPKEPAVITEIDGVVEFGGTARGMRKIIVKNESGMQKEYLIPPGKHLNIYRGDRVSAGQPLVDGPIVLEDILRIRGEEMLQEYLLNEIQEVYRLQGVTINDKHIEVIIRQMLKKVIIEDRGDTKFLLGEQIDRFEFEEENDRARDKGDKPATGLSVLLGITKAALATNSFVSAASFQETTRILTDAAASGKTDELRGLKENVIMGHLIPAGTGVERYHSVRIESAEEKK